MFETHITLVIKNVYGVSRSWQSWIYARKQIFDYINDVLKLKETFMGRLWWIPVRRDIAVRFCQRHNFTKQRRTIL